MYWLDKIIPLVSLIIGFSLSEFGKYYSDRKSNQKKLKKLLYNLLELRWLITHKINLKNTLSKLINKIYELAEANNELEKPTQIDDFKILLIQIAEKSFQPKENIEDIEKKIDSVLNELSELYPIFAYELSGRYKIKDKLNSFNDYFTQINQQFSEFPEELKSMLEQKGSNELIEELDKYIKAIGKKIGIITYKTLRKKLEIQSLIDSNEVDKFYNDYLQEINKKFPS